MNSSVFFNKRLLSFFHKNKTEMSIMENPLTFLKTLKDHELIPEDKYREVEQATRRESREDAVYRILEFIEKKKSHLITTFWVCVSKEFILKRYPTLKRLHSRLKDGFKRRGFVRRGHLPLLKHREMHAMKVAQKNEKTRVMIMSSIRDCNLPGPSSQPTAGQREPVKKTGIPSPIKGKKQLQVTCGTKKGILIREKLAKGEECIWADKQWFTPSGFEEHGGRGSSRNWKLSIQHDGISLGKLIKVGHLKAARYTRKTTRVANLRK